MNDIKDFERIKNRIESKFESRGFEVLFFDDGLEAVNIILNSLSENVSVGYGGSKTLKQIGLFSEMSKNGIKFDDREGALTRNEKDEIQRRMMNSDVYFSSANAISLDGAIVNIDHSGNRVAALLYGPKKVYVVVGVNKICATEDDAISRARKIASPLNAKRNETSYQPPCLDIGKCINCDDDRICSSTVIINKCIPAKRIKLIIINEKLGY